MTDLSALSPVRPTLPANTVLGRLGINPGPAQAIPFLTLASALLGSTGLRNVLDSIPSNLHEGIADGTNTTDLAVYLQAASADVPVGGTLWWPAGTYLVLGSGSQAILMTNNNQHWVGDGWGSWIKVDTSFPNTRDIVAIVPTAASRDWSFSHMRIGGGALARGRNVFHVDATDNAGYIYFVAFDRMLLDAADTSGGGYSFRTTNAAGSNPNGGMLYSTFQGCVLDSMMLEYVGDGITIRNCTFDGTLGNKMAITANGVTGAANFVIQGCIGATYAEGFIQIDGGISFHILDNWYEQNVNSTNADGAIIDINGGISTVIRAVVESNTIAVNTGVTGVTAPIRIDNAQDTTIDNNYIDTQAGSHVVVVSTPAVRTLIRSGGTFRIDHADQGLIVVTDAGTDTITPYKQVFVQAVEQSKVGSVAGWVVAAANDLPLVTLPASQTGSVLITPLVGFLAGDLLLTVAAIGQIESAGDTVSGTLDVRKATAAAADFADVSLGTDTISVTADTLISSANLAVVGLADPLDGTEVIYAKLTMSTLGVACDVAMGQYIATVYRK